MANLDCQESVHVNLSKQDTEKVTSKSQLISVRKVSFKNMNKTIQFRLLESLCSFGAGQVAAKLDLYVLTSLPAKGGSAP